jgi:hypothetical protein
MQWSKEGVHLLLQSRVRTLNGALADIFTRWYQDLDMKAKEIPIAASPPPSLYSHFCVQQRPREGSCSTVDTHTRRG